MAQQSNGGADEIASVNGSSAPATNEGSPSSLQQLRATALRQPGNATAWRALGRELRSKGERVGGAAAFARSITASLLDAELTAIEKLMQAGKFREASDALKLRLEDDGDDIVALRLAGDVGAQSGRTVEAEQHYRHCIDLCPSYVPARYGLSRLLLRQARLGEASNESERMLVTAPLDPTVRTLKAAIAANVGNHEDAGALYEGLVRELPHHPAIWLGLGHSHRTMGRADQAIRAYRRALEIPSGAAEAYWSLSNLKTYGFEDVDLQRMQELAGGA